MNIDHLVANLSEDMFFRLKHAAETGRWPEGEKVSESQKQHALQLVIAYQAKHMNNTDMLTVGSDGEIIHKTKRELKSEFKNADGEITPCDKNNIARFTEL